MNPGLQRWLAGALLLLAGHLARADDLPLAGLDDFVREAMAVGGVPGLSLVIVQNDRIVAARGYGTRTTGTQQRVDADTMFGLASLTKAFTATAAGILVDRGKLQFDEPLAQALPGFRVADDYVSRQATVRDALAHRTGTAAADLLWYVNRSATAQGLVERVAALPQQSTLRDRFHYNNLMYVVAGEVVARRAGASWEEFVAAEILAPLGMTRTAVRLATLDALPNVASAHIPADGHIVQVPHHAYQNTAASGALYASVADVGRWMRMLLNEGSLEGRRVISQASLAETMKPQMIVGPAGPTDELLFPNANFITYGMGWFVSDYRGHRMLSHTGGIDGMASFIALLPEQKLGIAVLENLETDLARAVIRNWIFDRYLGATDIDWRKRYSTWMLDRRQRAAAALQAAQNSRLADTQPSIPLTGFAGRYANPLLGAATVRLDDAGGLSCQVGDLPPIALRHWHHDSFALPWPDANLNTPGPTLLTFQQGAGGRPAGFVISGPILSEDAVYHAVTD